MHHRDDGVRTRAVVGVRVRGAVVVRAAVGVVVAKVRQAAFTFFRHLGLLVQVVVRSGQGESHQTRAQDQCLGKKSSFDNSIEVHCARSVLAPRVNIIAQSYGIRNIYLCFFVYQLCTLISIFSVLCTASSPDLNKLQRGPRCD